MRNRRLWISFIGIHGRADMIRLFNEQAMAYFKAWGRDDANGLVMFFLAMVENISDHAGGIGSVMIKHTSNGFEFDIQDGGTESHDFDLLIGNSTKAGNGINFGNGLRFLMENAQLFGITLNVDTTRGFHYTGVILHT